jgi:hypothetical protein
MQGPHSQSSVHSLANALHQLRTPPLDFTGREIELASLRTRLGNGGAIIAGLAGQGGIGKTALALVLAQELRDRCSDAQIEIDMRGTSIVPITSAEAMAHVIRAFDPSAQIPESDTALAAQYRSALSGKRILLLLDDVRDQDQIEPLTPPPLGCLMLVTSRRRFVLPGLEPYDLTRLRLRPTRRVAP